ncbi:ABC transporter substrate-binding protein [Deinococcus multiflagellatus]|uniref:ABC transporter substrate-binding protein n=1 Tax=Deinococcus multiflagellatus TaxID=1656887 RepID=A0ABW1ZRW0_9DEIO|nr:ABC transporter substrate-binding protein [Deinococcus multiflagellatus]MBZ9715013.1 ABC transporter substrate-binding protein [Deinococcus multiflagellatus]
MKKLVVLGAFLASVASASVPKDTLVFMSAGDISTLDPGATYDVFSSGLVDQMYETLVTYRGTSIRDLEPLLATRWTISNGGTTYTFDLRRNVKFHSGATMTCADAEYTFERNLVTNSGASGNWFLSEALLGSGANANDDKSVTWARIDHSVECNAAGQLVFTLPRVDPAFLAKLAYSGQAIIEKNYTAGLGEWSGTERDWKAWVGKDLSGSNLSKKPNGTGPYRLVKAEPDVHLFEASNVYWGPVPAIRHVIRQRVPELAARQQAFLRGDADFIEGASRSVDEAQVRGKPGVTWVDELPNVGAAAIVMNQNISAPSLLGSGKLDGKGIPANFFSDVNVRRAFNAAFNAQQFIREVQDGKGAVRTMLLPDSFPGYDAGVGTFRYDAAAAAAYFKKAWGGQVWNNGFTLTANYRADTPAAQAAMELLKKNVEALNPKFRINLLPKPWSELFAASLRGEEAMVLIGWAPDYADPDNFMSTFYASDGFYSPSSHLKDAQMDQWLKAARATVNTAERNRLYSLVGRRAYEQAPYIVLPAPVGYAFYRSEVQGWMFNPMTALQWKRLSKA